MSFAYPWAFLLLALLPLFLWLYGRRDRHEGGGFPTSFPKLRHYVASLRHGGICLRLLTLGLLVFALARPQDVKDPGKKKTEGLDIILVVDTSGSMDQRDFFLGGAAPTRLEVVKAVIRKFIDERPDDRLGIVVFGTEAFTQAPLTLDHDVLHQFLAALEIGMAGESTAIGDGLATAVARFKDVEAKEKVAILLTDGSNQAGRVDPKVAAQTAKAFGVKVYTIGVVGQMSRHSSSSGALEVDETLLREMATMTGGRYFQAGDAETLMQVYQTIDQLEKTKKETPTYDEREEHYRHFAWPALAFLVGELLFGVSRFRRVP